MTGCMHDLVFNRDSTLPRTLLPAGSAENSDNSRSLALSLPLSPPLPEKTPPLHLSVTPSLSCIWSVLHFLPAEAGDNSTLHTGRHSNFPLWSCRCLAVAGLFCIGCDSERNLYWVRVERAIINACPYSVAFVFTPTLLLAPFPSPFWPAGKGGSLLVEWFLWETHHQLPRLAEICLSK